jgi:hypothetical protein
MANDPDEVIREHGAAAMQEVIDGAIPMRAKLLHDVLVRGEIHERDLLSKAWRLTERDLLEAAGGILALVHMMRTGDRGDVDHRSADLQRAVIALAARGSLAAARIGGIPDDAFTGAPRLFAWWCASRACRILGKRATLFHTRYVLATAPRPDLPGPPRISKADVAEFREAHGYEATVEWLLGIAEHPNPMTWLWRETEAELDAAEGSAAPRDALALLLADHRARRVRTYLQPVIAGLDGDPVIDTAARLRAAADIYDGK